MKTKRTLLFVAASVAVLNLNPNLRAGQPSRSGPAPPNRAFLAAPRTIEEFPSLARISFPGDKVRPQAVRVWKRTFAASPRVLEEFPELARVAPSRAPGDELAALSRNRALLVAPRTLEEFPALSRGSLRMAGNLANGATPSVAGMGR
jgi:hypothetical protein